jgi:tripartite-type tricarboxylate transporter receptor subunit TctC
MTMNIDRRTLLAGLGGTLAASLSPTTLFAQAGFPAQPVTLIVPNGAGGPSDVTGRIFAEALGRELKGTVVVENKPGAGGLVGAEFVSEAKPDGYTLLYSSNSSFSVLPAVRKDMPFDVSKDLVVVGTVARGPQALVVRTSLGVNTVDELIAKAKAEPGTLKFASTGPGTIVHMAGEMFKYFAGIDIIAIPYEGGGQAVAAMLSGEIDMMVNDLSPVMQHIEAGTIKALAVSNDKRIDVIPDTPTFIEVGLPDVVTSSWFAVAAPSKTPPETLATLSKALKAVVASDGFKESLKKFGLEPFDLSQEEATKFIASELDKWKTLVAKANIKLD